MVKPTMLQGLRHTLAALFNRTIEMVELAVELQTVSSLLAGSAQLFSAACLVAEGRCAHAGLV